MENHVVVAWGTPVNTHVYVFYGHQLYKEYPWTPAARDVPEDALLYYPAAKVQWVTRFHTPVLLEDVPKPVRALVLLMGI